METQNLSISFTSHINVYLSVAYIFKNIVEKHFHSGVLHVSGNYITCMFLILFAITLATNFVGGAAVVLIP